jgi:hypothetical protein
MAGTVLRPSGKPESADKKGAVSAKSQLFANVSLYGGALFAVGLLIAAIYFVAKTNNEWVMKHRESQELYHELNPQPDQLYVVWRECFRFEDLLTPFGDIGIMHNFRCVSMSLLLPTPFTQRRLQEFKIDDIYLAICDRPDVYLIAIPDLVIYLHRYLNEHYHRLPKFDWVFGRPPSLAIWQVHEHVVPPTGANR